MAGAVALGRFAARHRGKLLVAAIALLALGFAVFAFDVPLAAILLLAVLWLLGYLAVRWQMPPKSHWPRGRD
jgi:predicted MFS family arabinose efflux permease